MAEISRHVLRVEAGGKEASAEQLTCPTEYDLRGPQVEPEASWWIECLGKKGDLCPLPRPVTIKELLGRVDPLRTNSRQMSTS